MILSFNPVLYQVSGRAMVARPEGLCNCCDKNQVWYQKHLVHPNVDRLFAIVHRGSCPFSTNAGTFLIMYAAAATTQFKQIGLRNSSSQWT